MSADGRGSAGGVTEEEQEDRRYERVVLLDPPPSERSLTVTLPDGTSFRPMELMVCPLCGEDYLLGSAELLRTKYLGTERAVGVCPSCASEPPEGHRRKLRIALGRFPWTERSGEEAIGEGQV